MQISKISRLFPAICAAALCSSLVIVRADDTPAQATARAALMQKLNELNETAAQPTSPPPVIVTPAEVKVEAPAPVVIVPPAAPAPIAVPAPSEPAVQPAPAPAISDTEAQVKARAALQQKLSEMDEQPAAPPEKVLIEKTQTPPEAAPVVNEIKSPDSQMSTNPAPVVMEPAPAVVVQPAVKPIETPALPISATKEERLQALLEKYKADQITPEEYHTERAKIIGEP